MVAGLVVLVWFVVIDVVVVGTVLVDNEQSGILQPKEKILSTPDQKYILIKRKKDGFSSIFSNIILTVRDSNGDESRIQMSGRAIRVYD